MTKRTIINRINKRYKVPRFTIKVWVKNKGNTTVSAHLGASLVCDSTGQEYYNTADDIKKDFAPGSVLMTRYLNTDLGPVGKYTLYIALWEGEKTIGHGIKYAHVELHGAVEKKNKKIIKFELLPPGIFPTSFTV